MRDRDVLFKRLQNVGLAENRFIPVQKGSKASVVSHADPSNRHSDFENLTENYGVYAGTGLLDVDVDDYGDDETPEGLEEVNSLPDTLMVESPHTDGENGGHRYYLITTDKEIDDFDVESVLEGTSAKTKEAAREDPVALQIADELGVVNPKPEWGEVRVTNQYVVGPGSELDSCDKHWHDCSKPGEGMYRISKDREIAELDVNTLIDVLRASGYGDSSNSDADPESSTTLEDFDGDGDYEEAKDVARHDAKIVGYLTDGPKADFDGDRSQADFYLACRMIENDISKHAARRVAVEGFSENHTPPTKARERGATYWDRTWENAIEKVREENGDDFIPNVPIEVENGKTYYIKYTDDGPERQQILNFKMDVDSVLRMNGREVIDAEMKTPAGSRGTVQFEPRDLQKKQRFKDNVLAGRFGLTFDPSGARDETILNALNRYINRLDAPTRRGTHHIGLHGDEWVTPVGTLSQDGWLDDPETVYVTRDVALERAFSLSSDSAEYDTANVRKILRKLPETRDTARILAVLGWYYAAPLRPLVFDEWNAGAFNHLNVTGDTGSGKTTTLRYLWQCFGVNSDPFAVTDTKFAMLTALSASNGLPVWYDEYKPSDIQDYRLNQFHDLLRKAATGGTATRGRADQTTEEYHTHAPMVISGEEQIRRPAERRRSIMVAFREDVTDKDTDTWAAFKNLTGEDRMQDGELATAEDAPDPSDHAIAYYRWITGADVEDLRASWQDAREIVWESRRSWENSYDLDELEVQGLRTVAFGWKLMRKFGEFVGLNVTELPDMEDLDSALRHIAGEIGPAGQRKSHLDNFVELFGRASAAGYVEEGQHYAVVHKGEVDEELRIHLKRGYDALSKYARDHDLGSEDLLSNADDYRKRFKEAASDGDSYVTTHTQVTPPLGRCAGISTIEAMNKLDFNRQSLDMDAQETMFESPNAEKSQEELIQTVRSVITTHAQQTDDNRVDTELIVEKLNDSYEESRLNHAIEKLKNQGTLMEPELGKLEVN